MNAPARPPPAFKDDTALKALIGAVSVDDQMALREGIRGEHYWRRLLDAYFGNPFLRLTPEEAAHLLQHGADSPLRYLMAARDAAIRVVSPRYAVFCMPKSGSSFVKSALCHALELPSPTLTSFGHANISSRFGMNAREQELDEAAIIKCILGFSTGFVAQHHTRHTIYLALQLRYFRITPIVTIRNVLDCIVSFDEMMLQWRGNSAPPIWSSDAQFPLPTDYPERPPAVRYDLLARSFGVWLISFYLSWRRSLSVKIVSPLTLMYERDVLDRDMFVQRVSEALAMTPAQTDRLSAYARDPDRERSRFNVGVQGRGRALVPDAVKQSLLDYARLFDNELEDREIAYLLE